MSTPPPSRAPVGLDEAAHLQSLAERIHSVADELPTPRCTYSLASIGEEVEDQVRAISALFASIASEAAFHGRAARRHPGPNGVLAHRKIALMTRAAAPLGWALAKLGEAVAQIGRLHEISARPRTPERAGPSVPPAQPSTIGSPVHSCTCAPQPATCTRTPTSSRRSRQAHDVHQSRRRLRCRRLVGHPPRLLPPRPRHPVPGHGVDFAVRHSTTDRSAPLSHVPSGANAAET